MEDPRMQAVQTRGFADEPNHRRRSSSGTGRFRPANTHISPHNRHILKK